MSDSKITILAYLSYANRSLKVLRLAPNLPPGVSWHDGMQFFDGFDNVIIDCVVASADGSIELVSENDFADKCDESEVARWISAGWEVVADSQAKP